MIVTLVKHVLSSFGAVSRVFIFYNAFESAVRQRYEHIVRPRHVLARALDIHHNGLLAAVMMMTTRSGCNY
jgi:hypothetical protein